MTFSDAWIDSVDDEEFAAFLTQSPRFRVLPPPSSPYWINHVRGWAKKEGLAIKYPGDDDLEIRVLVTRRQLVRFFDDMFGPLTSGADRSTLHGYVVDKCRDDRTYLIAADEF
ncbi:hypothetical protein [Paraburkholderia sp. MM5477-R1]|uniref:hypothetical protein n=1 Tax=Paraburkholderia sp. MM5477-R1 TaxID=2991062 RepID=UPI003D1BF2A6